MVHEFIHPKWSAASVGNLLNKLIIMTLFSIQITCIGSFDLNLSFWVCKFVDHSLMPFRMEMYISK